jgi:exonuclease III
MNVLSWNCNQAFRKKCTLLSPFSPDIAVISECESLEKLNAAHLALFDNQLWIGDNPNKGLGIFATSDYELSIHPAYNEQFRWIVPIQVKGVESFTLIAVWTKNHKERKKSYIGQLYLALEQYRLLLQDETIVIAGDLNSNAIWDHLPRVGNHSAVLQMLHHYGITSAYHFHYGEQQGSETRPTYFFHYDRNKGYHIDYVFAPLDWLIHLESVIVGTYDEWRQWSDHVPMLIQFKRSFNSE